MAALPFIEHAHRLPSVSSMFDSIYPRADATSARVLNGNNEFPMAFAK